METALQVKRLLGPTTVPDDLVEGLLAEASAVWLMGQPAAHLAADLALCHPPLGPEEVRALVLPAEEAGGPQHIAVLAHDRPGLLAGTAGALATHGVSVLSASATTWPERNLALQRVLACGSDQAGVGSDGATNWELVGEHLRAVLGRGELRVPTFEPVAGDDVTVELAPQLGERVMATVEAPDRVGLLWAIASWFEVQGCNIEVARVATEHGRACDTFVVVGEVDAGGLVTALSAARPAPHPGHGPIPVLPVAAAIGLGVGAARTGWRLGRKMGGRS